MYRRNLLGVLTGATAVSLSGCSSLSPAGTAGAEAGLSVDDASLEVTSSQGVIDEVWIFVVVDFEYSGWYDHEITNIPFHTKIDGETILDKDYGLNHPDWLWDEDGDENSGSGRYRVFQERLDDRIYLFEDAPNYEQADLEVDEPGETKTLELELDIEMRLVADQDDVVWTGSDTATITITHTYEADDDDSDSDNGDDDIVTEDGDASMGIGDIGLYAEVDGELVS